MLSQDYPHYRILYVDDASDYTPAQKAYIQQKLRGHVVVFNRQRKYSVRNAYELIHTYARAPNAVVVNLDGDDWLYTSHALSHLVRVYRNARVWMTYGNCVLWDGRGVSELLANRIMSECNIPYSPRVIRTGSYRRHQFRPLHLRSWKVWLYKKIRESDFHRADGAWLQYAEDMAMFFPMMEMAGHHMTVVATPLYCYNMFTPLADVKLTPLALWKDELEIRKKPHYETIT